MITVFVIINNDLGEISNRLKKGMVYQLQYSFLFLPVTFPLLLISGLSRLKYSMNAVADKGPKRSHFTSARLKKGEVLYIETHFRRYIFWVKFKSNHQQSFYLLV